MTIFVEPTLALGQVAEQNQRVALEVENARVLEIQTYPGPSRSCLVTHLESQQDIDPRRSSHPLEPGVSYASRIATAIKENAGKPKMMALALRGHEQHVLITGVGTRLLRVNQGVAGVALVSDCLGIVVGSVNAAGEPLISSAHISIPQGYTMNDVARCIQVHKGAVRIGIAVVGCEWNSVAAAHFGTNQTIENGTGPYRTLIQTVLGPTVAIDRIVVRVKQTPPDEIAKQRWYSYVALADTNQPTHPSVEKFRF